MGNSAADSTAARRAATACWACSSTAWMVATRRRRAAHEALHPVHHFALAQSAHGQRKQYFAQRVPLIFLQQPDLRRARPPQPRHANLMQRAPQRRPTLAHLYPQRYTFSPRWRASATRRSRSAPSNPSIVRWNCSKTLCSTCFQACSNKSRSVSLPSRDSMSGLSFRPRAWGPNIRRHPFPFPSNFQQKTLQTAPKRGSMKARRLVERVRCVIVALRCNSDFTSPIGVASQPVAG